MDHCGQNENTAFSNCEKLNYPAEEQFNDPADERAIQLLDILRQLDIGIAEQRSAAQRNGIHLPLLHLFLIFHLASFEEQSLIICLALEPDIKYEKLHTCLHDDTTLRQPNVAPVPDLHGHYGTRKKSPAKATRHDPGIPLLIADPGAMTNNRFPMGEHFRLIGREAIFPPAALSVIR
jgi:hypothetical protein